MEVKEIAKKEIEKVSKIVKSIKLLNPNGSRILELINSYFKDAQYFYDRGQFLQAFEAAVICWTYADAGLHLGIFSVPENLKTLFTA